MNADLDTALRTSFGFSAFRPGQAEAIQSLLGGRHTLVVMPTGAGKSLVYQLAALQRPGVTLVISPLIALMHDQVTSLVRRRIPATFINSTLDLPEQNRRLGCLARGDYRLVYVAPERLRNAPFLDALSRVDVDFLAVDEAHCISQWGHDFRPDYLQIGSARARMKNPVTAALTATATPRVQDDIVRLLGLGPAERIITGFNRPNLCFEVRYAPDLSSKFQVLKELLTGLDGGAAIVYVGTRRDAEEVAEFTRTVVRVNAGYYHGGLDAEIRTSVQNEFLAGDLPVVVATNAFGMGIDRADVRLVAHHTVPGTLESYYQEAGRAGRDGEPARAVLIYATQDRALQEWFIECDLTTADDLRALYRALGSQPRERLRVTSDDLSLATGFHQVKVKLGLAQLEIGGAIERLGDEGAVMLVRVNHWDEVVMRKVVADKESRRRFRLEQLDNMVAYAESNSCRRRILLAHFGDESEPDAAKCCDNCAVTDVHPVEDAPDESTDVAHIILDTLSTLKWEVGQGKLAGLLKGSHAKELQQFGYDRHPSYGKLADVSVDGIKDLIRQLIAGGFIKAIGGTLPVLRMTPKGEAALEARSPIKLRVPQQARGDAAIPERTCRSGYGAGGRLERHRPSAPRVERVVQLGRDGSPSALTELVAALEDPDGNVRRLAASALGKIGDPRAVGPLSRLLQREALPQVRLYAVKALGVLGDPRVRPLLEAITADGDEREYTRFAAHLALKRLGQKHPCVASDDVAAFLRRSHPQPLKGPWHAGWALDFHSRFAGADWNRSSVGKLAYCLKYQSDVSAVGPLVGHILSLCRQHPDLADVDAIVPMPRSTARPFDPVRMVADALGKRFRKPVEVILARTRQTAAQKEMHSLAQKKANVAGAFVVKGNAKGRKLLILDDLYDSGMTLEEASNALKRAGAARICVLTLTRTIHSDA